jgi:putative zinc finger protein
MDTRNSKEMFAHSNVFHEQKLALFDAYITSELDEDEKIQLEEHMNGCQECQQLFAEVTRFRQQIGILIETDRLPVPEKEHAYASQITQSVMVHIEQEKKAGSREQQTQTHHRASAPSTPVRKRTVPLYLRIIAAMLCLFLLTGLIVTLHQNTNISGRGAVSVPPPIVWITQQHYMLVQNGTEVFTLKEIEITTQKEIRFYYVFKSSYQKPFHVTADSALSTGQGQNISLSATVQPLGTIDSYDIGIIHVQYLDRAGQTVTLHITSSAMGNVNWHLSPLKQLIAEPHPEGSFYGFSVDQRLFPAIVWSGPAGRSEQSQVAFFKASGSAHYIFLQVDYLGKIRVITKEECIQLGGEQNCH